MTWNPNGGSFVPKSQTVKSPKSRRKGTLTAPKRAVKGGKGISTPKRESLGGTP